MITHGMTYSPEYTAWRAMIKRCEVPGTAYYDIYGGAGISVYPEWRKSFQKFYDHIGKRPSPTHSLDRIDHTKNYEPGNVRWATKLQQTLNRKLTSRNTSGFRGIRYDRFTNKWRAEVSIDNRKIHLGSYPTAEDAAYVRDQVAMQIWGDDAKLNLELL